MEKPMRLFLEEAFKPVERRTYCSGLRCMRVNTCALWTGNLYSQLRREGEALKGYRLSVAQYADHAGQCSRYEPLPES